MDATPQVIAVDVEFPQTWGFNCCRIPCRFQWCQPFLKTSWVVQDFLGFLLSGNIQAVLLMEKVLHHLGCIKPANNGLFTISTGARRISEPSTVVLPQIICMFFVPRIQPASMWPWRQLTPGQMLWHCRYTMMRETWSAGILKSRQLTLDVQCYSGHSWMFDEFWIWMKIIFISLHFNNFQHISIWNLGIFPACHLTVNFNIGVSHGLTVVGSHHHWPLRSQYDLELLRGVADLNGVPSNGQQSSQHGGYDTRW